MLYVRVSMNRQDKNKLWTGSKNDEGRGNMGTHIHYILIILFLCSLFINFFIQAAVLTCRLLVWIHLKLNTTINLGGRSVHVKNLSSLTSLVIMLINIYIFEFRD